MSTSGRHGVLAGFVAASAFALIPLAAAGAAWADDDFSGDSGAAVVTPIGSSNIGGGADLGLPNPLNMLPTFGDGANAGGAAINTPVGGSSVNTASGTDLGTGGADVSSNTAAVATPVGNSTIGGGTDLGLPNPLNMLPTFGDGANAGGGAAINTPIGGSSFNTGAEVNTPVGGGNVGGGTSFNFGH